MTTVAFNGADLHYDLIDRRLPWVSDDHTIVFHHGVAACAAMWSGWDSVLADRHRLLRFDMRGHGRSAVPQGYRWTLDALVDDLDAVITAADVEHFHLVGESIGGTVALASAARRPERVRTLTISNGAHRGAPIRNLARWGDIIASGGMGAWSDFMMEMRFFDGAIDAEQWQWYRDQQSGSEGEVALALAAALSATDLTAQLPAITMPTLLLHPDSSPFISVGLMAELLEALPDSRLEVFAHARHGLPFSHATQCAELLAAFINTERLPIGESNGRTPSDDQAGGVMEQ